MEIKPAPQASLTGIKQGLRGLQQTAQEIASSNKPETKDADLARNLVDLKTDKTAVQANTKAAKAYLDTLGTIIDTFA